VSTLDHQRRYLMCSDRYSEGLTELELLIGFPPAPFILPLVVNDRAAFASYAITHPSHVISIRRRGEGATPEWTATPAAENAAYRLSFVLPSGIEEWIAENEDRRRSRARMIKNDFLATITIYFQDERELRVCHLRYDPGALREDLGHDRGRHWR
jgi:hypothetical protein